MTETSLATADATADDLPTADRYLAGNFAPVREERTVTGLPVTGQLPAELSGRLTRIGPNPIAAPDLARHHWFSGEGMVHGLRLRDGRAEWYRNRYVRSEDVSRALGEPPRVGPAGVAVEANNTNVVRHAGRTLALVEAGYQPVELDDELDTVGAFDFGGTLAGGFAAHPHEDPATGQLHAMSYTPGEPDPRYIVVDPAGRVVTDLVVPTIGGAMVHDIGLTASTAVVLDLSVRFDPAEAEREVGLPYTFQPGSGARVGLLPRTATSGDDVQWFDVEPCFVFHVMNAFDTEHGVVLDVCRWDRAFDRDRHGVDQGAPRLERWTVDRRRSDVAVTVVDDRGMEFPRFDERRQGIEYRYGYTATWGEGLAFGPAHKVDLRTGEVTSHDYGPGRVTLEPLFVPRQGGTAEDDGWLMSYVYDRTTDTTDVVVLDARDLAAPAVATVRLPVRVPFGFHGNWLPDVAEGEAG